jgi:hypothetical protein
MLALGIIDAILLVLHIKRRNVMRALLNTIGLSLVPAIAFASGTRVDNSGVFVWVFLGFCSLIVVSQIVPAVLLMTGMVKGVISVVKDEKVTNN